MAVGTSVFFAGAEVKSLTRALLDNGVRNILYSYYYILEMGRERFISDMQDEYPEVNWFLDSGAFTYYINYKTDPGSLPPVRKYVRRYFAYIEEYGERFCRITEPDMDIAGQELDQVDDWREEMLERWPHLNVTPVWHNNRGRDAWYEYLFDKRIKTLAMGSGDIHRHGIGTTRRMVMDAMEAGKPTHGFGCTRLMTTLRQVPFDSVDSTTWVMGQKNGTTFIFRNNRFTTISTKHKSRRKQYKNYFQNIGCDPKLVLADNVAEVRKANIIGWRCLADRLEWLKKQGRQTQGVDHTIFTTDDVATETNTFQRAEAVPKPKRKKRLPKVQRKQAAEPLKKPRKREGRPIVKEPNMPGWFPQRRDK